MILRYIIQAFEVCGNKNERSVRGDVENRILVANYIEERCEILVGL